MTASVRILALSFQLIVDGVSVGRMTMGLLQRHDRLILSGLLALTLMAYGGSKWEPALDAASYPDRLRAVATEVVHDFRDDLAAWGR